VTPSPTCSSKGVPLEDVQRLAGHADPRTTRLYDRRQKNHPEYCRADFDLNRIANSVQKNQLVARHFYEYAEAVTRALAKCRAVELGTRIHSR